MNIEIFQDVLDMRNYFLVWGNKKLFIKSTFLYLDELDQKYARGHKVENLIWNLTLQLYFFKLASANVGHVGNFFISPVGTFIGSILPLAIFVAIKPQTKSQSTDVRKKFTSKIGGFEYSLTRQLFKRL